MKLTTTALAAAALFVLAGTDAARAESQGILTCQISLSQFEQDVIASKARLRPAHLEKARQLVEDGRGQCRSGPSIVMAEITAMRAALPLTRGSSQQVAQANDFWPATPQELAAITE